MKAMELDSRKLLDEAKENKYDLPVASILLVIDEQLKKGH